MATYRYYVLAPAGPGKGLTVKGLSRTEEAADTRTPTGGKVVYASTRAMALRRADLVRPKGQ